MVGTGGALEGWARACSVFVDNCTGILKPDSELGGWDGWISMSGLGPDGASGTSDDYGVTHNSGTGQLTGFAWGADVVGWINFCADPTTGACVTIDSLNAICTPSDASGDGIFNVGEGVTWQASVVSGGVSPYSYSYIWSSPSANVNGQTTGTVPDSGYSSAQTVDASVKITDNTSGKSGTGVCSIDVRDVNNPTLMVIVNGSNGATGVANSNPDPIIGTIDGCSVASGSCSGQYNLSSDVIVTATPNDNPNDVPNKYSFSWSDCEPAWVSGSNCSVTMTGPKSLTLNFWDSTISSISLIATPLVIGIDYHTEGQSADSNKSTITATGVTADLPLRILSFTSAISGQTIDEVISAIPGVHPKLQCILNSIIGDCSTVSTILSPSNSIVTLQVRVPEKLIQILNNSPYRITIGTGRPGEQANITFQYRVRDIRP